MTVIVDDFAASPLTTGKLIFGSTVYGTLETATDADWFAVSLTAGVNYQFTIALTGTGAGFPTIGLFDATGKAFSVPSDSGNGILQPFLNVQPTSTGLYYIAARAAYGSGPYALSASVHTEADDFSANASGAGTLTVNGDTNGVFEFTSDRDWYKFHADAGTHYGFSSIPALIGTYTSAAMPVLLRVVDANGNGLSVPGSNSFDVVVSGDYYLDVMGGLRTGNYSVHTTAVADDYPATDSGAGSVVAGGSVSGIAQYYGDDDRFAVALKAGNYYTFTLSGASNLALGISGDGVDRITNVDASNLSATQLTVLATSDQLAYADVWTTTSGYSDSLPKAYTLAVSAGRPDDIGDTPATALRAQVGSVVHGALQGGGDADVVAVTLQAGVTYSYTLTVDDGRANLMGMRLIDASGAPLNTTPLSLPSATFTPAHTGEYYTAVSTSRALTASVAYTLVVAQPQDDFGATATSAGRVAVGGSVAGVLEAGGGDHDWFAIDLTAGATYWFDLDGALGSDTNRAQLRLVDSNGNTFASASTLTTGAPLINTLSYLAGASGRYYLDVSSPTHNAGSYTLSAAIGVRDDFGNTPATAGVVTPSAPAAGVFELAGDTDMFGIALVAGNTYALTANGTTSGSPAIKVVDSLGVAIGTAWTPAVNGGVIFTAPSTGTGYITLSDSRAYSYVLKELDYGPDDSAGNANTKTVLPVGGTLQGALNFPGDVDWMRIHLDGGGIYDVQLLLSANGGGTLQSIGRAWGLRDGNGNVVAGSVDGGVDGHITFRPTTTGDYYFAIGDQNSAAMGSYSVKTLLLTGDVTGPALLTGSRSDGQRGVSLGDTAFKFVFSETVSIDHAAITLTDGAGRAVPLLDGSFSVDGNTLSLQAQSNFKPGTYTLALPHGGIHDLAGNAYTGPQTITFTTVLPTAPTGGNDLIAGSTGTQIDGGAGVDMVYYTDTLVQVQRVGATLVVRDYQTGLSDTLVNVERLLINGQALAYDLNGHGGQAYRLYQAAFKRTPDSAGVGFWIDKMDKGTSLHDVAAQFLASAELTTLYGPALSDNTFVTALYNNALHRAPDQAGLDYWINAMHSGFTRADLLVQFSESAENQAALVGTLTNGFAYTLY